MDAFETTVALDEVINQYLTGPAILEALSRPEGPQGFRAGGVQRLGLQKGFQPPALRSLARPRAGERLPHPAGLDPDPEGVKGRVLGRRSERAVDLRRAPSPEDGLADAIDPPAVRRARAAVPVVPGGVQEVPARGGDPMDQESREALRAVPRERHLMIGREVLRLQSRERREPGRRRRNPPSPSPGARPGKPSSPRRSPPPDRPAARSNPADRKRWRNGSRDRGRRRDRGDRAVRNP